MQSNIFIPKRINVGFQSRSDTYTKKLAYVIYYDQKNKLRKEASWNSWRDSKIKPQEFDNNPTSGFVLNKKVGDYVSDWNHRQAYVRIYDPRDFEFEITIENLLYILENTNSIKGKGLEGDFVYGWDGKDLTLIPVSSPDYTRLQVYNDIVHNNNLIKAKDLVMGATYLTKDNKEMIYLGKFDAYDYVYRTTENGEYVFYKSYRALPEVRDGRGCLSKVDYSYVRGSVGKQFFFAYKHELTKYIDGEYKIVGNEYYFEYLKSIGQKFISCVDINCNADYAEIFDKLEYQEFYSPIDESKDEFIDMTYKEFFTLINNKSCYWGVECLASPEIDGTRNVYRVRRTDDGLFRCEMKTDKSKSIITEDNRFKYRVIPKTSWYGEERKEFIPVTLEEAYNILKPAYFNQYLANGKFCKRRYNYE